MIPSASVNYQRILAENTSNDREGLISFLCGELPYEWADAYNRLSPHQANIMRITRDGFEYLFDFPSELVVQGLIAKDEAIEDRIVAVHGRSKAVSEKRKDSLMRKHPLGPVDFIRAYSNDPGSSRYDKGHFMGTFLEGCFT